MAEKAKVVGTDFAYFYKVTPNVEGEDNAPIYMPEGNWPEYRAKFEPSEFERVGGFPVYDTRVSVVYAVALYGTVEEAEAHGIGRDMHNDDTVAEVDNREATPPAEVGLDPNIVATTTSEPGQTEASEANKGKTGIKPRGK